SGPVGAACAASGGDDPAGGVQSRRQTETPGGEQGQRTSPASAEGPGHHGDQAASARRGVPGAHVVTNPKISPDSARGYGDNVKHRLAWLVIVPARRPSASAGATEAHV